MRLLRPHFIAVLFALGLFSSSVAMSAMEDGCLANLHDDLKRQDLADAIGLTYYTQRPAGITRKVKAKKSFKTVVDKKGVASKKEVITYDIRYFYPDGRPVKSFALLKQMNELGIPPAYTDVWISTNPESHILAIGRDARARPQYAYHPLWTEATSVTKFIRMGEFGKQIEKIRNTASADLRSRGLGKRKLLAAISIILQTGNIRVGSATYVRENGSYGLTTLLKKHIEVKGSVITFDFIGKEGIPHQFSITHRRVASVLDELLQKPGKELFTYVDEAGERHAINANDVKEYLEEITGGEAFTAKDFRTWQGTVATAKKLIELGVVRDAEEMEANIQAAIQYAADQLRNKPNTARDNYIYPAVLSAYSDVKQFQSILKSVEKRADDSDLSLEELFVLELIRRNR